MKRALILLGGDKPEPRFLHDLASTCDYVLCADSGLDAAIAADIHVDGVIGDFDSAEKSSVDYMLRKNIPHIVYPAIKDDTDGMACVRHVLAQKPNEVVLAGASGGRLDHYLGNVQLLVYLKKRGIQAKIEETEFEAWAVNGEHTVVGNKNDLLSVLQLTENLVVSESGVFYPLDHHAFEFGYPLGVSNVMTQEEAVIHVHEGWALVLHYHHA